MVIIDLDHGLHHFLLSLATRGDLAPYYSLHVKPQKQRLASSLAQRAQHLHKQIPDPITRCRSRRSAQGMPTTGAP